MTSMRSITNVSPELRPLWHPVGRLETFSNEPMRVELLGEALVVVRLNGELRVFRDVCPHRFARLSDGRVIDDTIQCPYHGWQFDSNGHCVAIPALGPEATLPAARLEAPLVAERYGLLWIALEKPVVDILPIAEWDDPNLDKIWMPPVDIAAGAAQAVDNFLDFSHFPFVHAGTFGSDQDRFVDDYSTKRAEDGWSFVVEYPHVIDNHEDPLVHCGEHPLSQPRLMRYHYRVPFTANLRLELPLTGMINAIIMWCQPMTLERTRVHLLMLRNDCPTPESRQAAIDYEMKIFTEDLKVIEYLADKSVPLDRGQVHIRSDRHTVEFRRLLNRLYSSDVSPDPSGDHSLQDR